ncbi:MAG: PilZ domain-containing protein [Polyangiaceae bacterium]
MREARGSILVNLEERVFDRHAVGLRCQLVRERDFKLLGVCAIDMSIGGMLVQSGVPVLTGEEVIVSFEVPWLRTWFDATGSVARVLHGRRPGDFGRAIGIRFDRLDSVTRAFMTAGLRYLPTLSPSRAPRIDYAASIKRISEAA